MSFELRHLRYVVAAAEHGSFRKAALALGIQELAVSRRIRDLEDEIGATGSFVITLASTRPTPGISSLHVLARQSISYPTQQEMLG